jgi:hypothetical protein
VARAHFVKKARKNNKAQGIKKGDSYWWWKFRRDNTKHYSKEKPKPSQLTQSEFLSRVFSIQEGIAELKADPGLEGEVESIVEELRDLATEQEEKRENMPEQLQDSETGELLSERAEACEAAATEFEEIDFEEIDTDGNEEEVDQAFWDEKLEQVQAISIEI